MKDACAAIVSEQGLAGLWGMNNQQVTNAIANNFKRFLTLNAVAVAHA
jgi:hypothetical protein